MRAIVSIIGRVHLESQRIRASLTFQMAHPDNGLPKTITFEPLWNNSHLRYQPLLLKCSQSMLLHHLQQHTGIIAGFTKLLARGLFATSPTTSGYTWLELMLLSIAMTDSPLSHIYTIHHSELAKSACTPTKRICSSSHTGAQVHVKNRTTNHVLGIHKIAQQNAHIWVSQSHYSHMCPCAVESRSPASITHTHVISQKSHEQRST